MWKTGKEVDEDFTAAKGLQKWKTFEKTWNELAAKPDGSGQAYLKETQELLTKLIRYD